MPRPIPRIVSAIVVPLVAVLGQTPDFCSSSAACYTPARGPQCPQVRFGWGNCPGSRQACDWCYGPNGVFAYTPRGSVYTLSSGCNQLGSNSTWSTQNPQVAQWMSNAGGNCTPDGRGGYTCSNVDAAKFKQAANCGNSGNQPPPCTTPGSNPGSGAADVSLRQDQNYCPQPKFIYFYINGINTPMINKDWRGNYVSEYGTVAVNLVRDTRGKDVTIPRSPFQEVPGSIQVANETDQMYGYTHNPSGKDPLYDDWYKQHCSPLNPLDVPCQILKLINDQRNKIAYAPGDLWESFLQSVNPFNYDDMVLKDDTAVKVIQAILDAYYGRPDQVRSQTYFIIVAHSQGNFFAEAIAKYMHDSRQEIFDKHLGIMALASPTNYANVGDQDFVSTKVVHHTRADDAINVVATLSQVFGAVGISAKTPFTSNDPPLWDWPSGLPALIGIRAGLLPSHDPQPRPDLFSLTELVTVKPAVPAPQYAPGRFFDRLGYDSGVAADKNPELYIPFLNSHLIDNYLDTPPPTKKGTPIKFRWGLVPWMSAPETTTVLPCIRRDLMALKKNLLNGPTTKFDSAVCTGN